MKRITIKKLSVKEVNKAIKEVKQYQVMLENRIRELVIALTDRGAEIAKMNVQQMGAWDTGVLESSIEGYFSPMLGVGIIHTNCYYAVYVEFGTGIVGSQDQHPQSTEYGYKYDINNHGEDGWFYYNKDTGRGGWTKGMPSRPFMYETVMQLYQECEKLAKQR